MIDVKVITSDNPTASQLEALRQYASVPNDRSDALLMRILKKAYLAVQAHADTALLQCTLKIEATDVEAGERIKLYQGGTDILTVIDENGNTPLFAREGSYLLIGQYCDSLTITYENKVNCAELEKLEPTVWQYATAMFDGEDASVLAGILAQTVEFGCL